jgi:hypothetical protein
MSGQGLTQSNVVLLPEDRRLFHSEPAIFRIPSLDQPVLDADSVMSSHDFPCDPSRIHRELREGVLRPRGALSRTPVRY